MNKNIPIILGYYFDNFISQQIKTGKYDSASEVKGEKSGFLENFDRKKILKILHQKNNKTINLISRIYNCQ